MARNLKKTKKAKSLPSPTVRYSHIIGDVLFGVGISALANNFDEIVKVEIERLLQDKFVVLFSTTLIVIGAVIKNWKGGKQ
jgi:hypothetical protein